MLITAAAAAVLFALAACGGANAPAPPGRGGARSAAGTGPGPAAALIPPDIRRKGTLTIATDSTYPPADFVANGTLQGWNIDLGRALAQDLGLKFTFAPIEFDALIPGIQAGRYDMGISTIFETPARERAVDFVTYFSDAKGIMVPAGSPIHISSLPGLCGATAVALNGSAEAADLAQQNHACQEQHRKPIASEVVPTQADANLALSSGRAQADIADWQTLAYIAKATAGRFKVTGKYSTVPAGIALAKGSELAKPLQAALEDLTRNGTYKKILNQWSVGSGALGSFSIAR